MTKPLFSQVLRTKKIKKSNIFVFFTFQEPEWQKSETMGEGLRLNLK